ncbi:MAG TPA: ferredoxin [Candidatus Magasanikbacteria bacterium]|nr:ferredoxin [Candidatus Magasanikbacteria bacterium]
MTPKVDAEKCIGCGACVAIAGNTFSLNAEGKSEVINPTGDPEDVIQQAVEGCPVGAITLE